MIEHSRSSATELRVAYLVNQYPKASHSFIRREMAALERLGVDVQRYAVRGWDADVPDPADARERTRTRYLLQGGLAPLGAAALRALVERPQRFVSALRMAWRLGRHADRPLPYHLLYLAQACLLREWLRRSGAVHLHAHFGTNPAEVAVLLAALGGPSCSFTVHGPEEFDRPTSLHLGEKIRHAAFVVAISSYGRSQLLRWAGAADWPRIHVVHCGLEADFHAGVAAAASSAPRLVCVGRICEQKGQLLLIEAAARLRDDGVAFELVLAGDGEMRAEIEARVRERNLQGAVRITGWIGSARVRAEILEARALVLPSFAEGLPVVIMEAMALRRPVISTYVAGIPELVENGRTGWLVAAGDIDELCRAMKQCLGAPIERLASMGEAGRARVIDRHDVDREAARLAALFADAVDRRVSMAGSPG
ncbi:MAG TPA: glycosyltransferase [Steroidobacteraceae bacterium]